MVFHLGRRFAPRLFQIDQRQRNARKISPGAAKDRRNRLDSDGGWVVRDEVANKIRCEEVGGSWMSRQLIKHREALLFAVIAIGLPQNGLRTGLVKVVFEFELAVNGFGMAGDGCPRDAIPKLLWRAR